MRIILILLALLPLAAMWYDIYLKREQQAREEAFLAVAEAVLIERLQAPGEQELLDPLVLAPEDDEGASWGIRGKLMLTVPDEELDRRRVAAQFDPLCDELTRRDCWQLASLSVDGRPRDIEAPVAAALPAESEADRPAEPVATAEASAATAPGDSTISLSSSDDSAAASPLSTDSSEAAAPADEPPLVLPAEPSVTAVVAVETADDFIVDAGAGSDSLPPPAEPPVSAAAAEEAAVALELPLEADAPAAPVEVSEDLVGNAEAEEPETPVLAGETGAAPDSGLAALPESPEVSEQVAALPVEPDATGAPAPPAEPDETASQGESGTPAVTAVPEPPSPPDRTLVASVQGALNALGYGKPRPLSVDGVIGPQTREAIRAYRRDNSLAGDAEVDQALLSDMVGRIETQTATEAAPGEALPMAVASPAATAAPSASPGIASLSSPQPDPPSSAATNPAPVASPEPPATRTQEAAAPAASQPQPAQSPSADETVDESLVYLIQDRLLRLGYSGGQPLTRDGKLNSRTVTLITAYQGEHGLAPDGKPTDALLRHMETALRQKNTATQ